MTIAKDRIVELRVEGMRTLKDVRLPLNGLRVLIGDNGSGKSSLIEALELLRKAVEARDFLVAIIEQHGGLDSLLRHGSNHIALTVRIDGADGLLEYRIALGYSGTEAIIGEESLEVLTPAGPGKPPFLIRRTAHTSRVYIEEQFQKHRQLVAPAARAAPGQLELNGFGRDAHPAVGRVRAALAAISVNVPFDVRSLWLEREQATRNSMRWPARLEPARTLRRLGGNLASCLHSLLQSGTAVEREQLLDALKLGLGQELLDIKTPAIQQGIIEINFQFRSRRDPVPLAALSDGQLAFVSMIVLMRMPGQGDLIAFDEPELHLHPNLIARITEQFELLAQCSNVLLSTHSDRLLDFLSDPAASVVLCELDRDGNTQLLRPDRKELAGWLESYRGIGQLRAEGYAPLVFESATEV